jgi:uncharacterized repeat protein (TIGR03803 family)
MRSRPSSYITTAILAIFALAMVLVHGAGAASTTKVIYSFAGDEDGEYPDTELVRDGAGNLYGTTVQGGDFGSGTVFQLTPSGAHTVLYSFTSGADGAQPYGGVTLDAQGNLYGATVAGGTGGACEGGCGVAYKLTYNGGTWTETVLHNFTGGNDGSGPGAGLTLDPKGNLYGMTPTGGAYGAGTIYQLHPGQNGSWRFKLVHAFTGGDDGASGSKGRMIFDDAGHLYGAATVGGAYGAGTVFELRRTRTGWALRTLYSFKGQPDAGFPYGGLIFDESGNLYGTTYYDGANDLGAVYQLHPRPGGSWRERVLYSFKGGSDGSNSISNLLFDANGNLYGTTSEGGALGCSCGTIFKMTPGGHGSWTESVVYAFTGTPDGRYSYNGMVADSAGNFYGATVLGGADDEGSIYRFTP